MATAVPPLHAPEKTALPATPPQPAAVAPSQAGADRTSPRPRVYWADWYCLRIWLWGAGILVALHLIDGLGRLLRLLWPPG